MTASGVSPAKGCVAAGDLSLRCSLRLLRPSRSFIRYHLPAPFAERVTNTVSQKAILVTGGAGYIGSHVLLQLRERGERVIVLDNLYTGFRQALGEAPLVVGDAGDQALVERVLQDHDVDTVMHFAAHTIVPESVSDPLKYYGNNTCATRSLLAACKQRQVRHFVFSSTAAVYGIPAGGIAAEDGPLAPINAYGTSKL